METGSASEFEALLADRPELLRDGVLAVLSDMASHPAFAGIGERIRESFLMSRDKPGEAWSKFHEGFEERKQKAQQLDGVEQRVREAILEGRFDEARALSIEAFAFSSEHGHELAAAMLHEEMAHAYRATRAGDRAANLEEAIRHAEATLPFAMDPEHRVKLGMTLAVMYGERSFGDRAENLETAIALLREGLSEIENSPPSDLSAILQTNLAQTLQVRQRGDRLENLREGRDLSLRALEYRSLDRSPEDWAYTQLNLGSIYADLVSFGEAELSEAEGALEAVIRERSRVAVPRLIAHAHGSLGGILRAEAGRLGRERVMIGPGPSPPPGEKETMYLENAADHLRAAQALVGEEAEAEFRGRVLNDLGGVLLSLGDEDGAISASREAIAVLGAELMPNKASEAGGRLGALFAGRRHWEEAAAAFRFALKASEFSFESRLETPDREAEQKSVGNLARWTSFALVQVGKVEEAVLVLENGRTRELRRRLGVGLDPEQLERLPEKWRKRWEAASGELAIAPLGPGSEAAARRFQEVLLAIRQLSGFENFAKSSDLKDVSAAAESDCPLVYVNPTPYGTALLTVTAAGSAEATVLDSPTSHEIFMTIVLTDVSDEDAPVSYAAGASGTSTREDYERFLRALKLVFSRMGAWLGEPIAELLDGLGVARVTLVPCGPLGLVPLQAAHWTGDDGSRICLLDCAEVLYAPSARLHAECLNRARARNENDRFLVALGNPDLGDPDDDLPGTQAEVEELEKMFAGEASVALRGGADSNFLQGQAPAATHLHLACHGKGGLLDPTEAGIDLSDGFLSGADVSGLELSTRLVVLSACQTGIADIGGLPDEVVSLSTSCLAAGSACAIASLWSVDDAGTALLMCRFYEVLLGGASPSEALRTAQLWLRELSDVEEVEFLKNYPSLEAEFQRRRDAGTIPRARAAAGTSAGRFASEEYWAPFIVVGA